jgi:hypothetical protein
MDETFGIIDCNNFYVSCERVFRPDLEGKPVIVLSNNDGCAVSRSADYVESDFASNLVDSFSQRSWTILAVTLPEQLLDKAIDLLATDGKGRITSDKPTYLDRLCRHVVISQDIDMGRSKYQGHDVRLIPAQFVKPFVKSNKNDFVDAPCPPEEVRSGTGF